MKVFGWPQQFDGARLASAVARTVPIKMLMSLLAEALNPAVPLAFRYLTFYKILELELRKNGYWTGLDDYLKQYEQKFAGLHTSKAKLKNFCTTIAISAHISRQDGATRLASRD